MNTILNVSLINHYGYNEIFKDIVKISCPLNYSNKNITKAIYKKLAGIIDFDTCEIVMEKNTDEKEVETNADNREIC